MKRMIYILTRKPRGESEKERKDRVADLNSILGCGVVGGGERRVLDTGETHNLFDGKKSQDTVLISGEKPILE